MQMAAGSWPQESHRYHLGGADAYRTREKNQNVPVACRLDGQLLMALVLHTCSLAGHPQDPATFPIRQVVVSVRQAKGPYFGAQCHRLGQQQEGHIVAPLWVGIGPMQDELL